jgi:hypothetical protein
MEPELADSRTGGAEYWSGESRARESGTGERSGAGALLLS